MKATRLLDTASVNLQNTLPASGSSQPWYHYIWCTPGTETYTFFNFGQGPAAPALSSQSASAAQPSSTSASTIASSQSTTTYDVAGTLAKTVTILQKYLNKTADGPISGTYTAAYAGMNVELYVQNHEKERVTYGVLVSAFTGLYQVVTDYNHKNTPIVIQINDGKWGELGIGYVGLLVGGNVTDCQYSVVPGEDFPCEQVVNGTVVGGLT
jgi:hypothetical protein